MAESHAAPAPTADPALAATLLTGLLADGAALRPGADLAAALTAHRERLRGPDGELSGPFVLPAAGVDAFRDALTGADLGLRVALTGDVEDVRQARNMLLDDDRVEVVGLFLDDTSDLDALDFTAPAALTPDRQQWARDLLRLAEDGAEQVHLPAGGPQAAGAEPGWLAQVLRGCVDRGLQMVVGGPVPGTAPALAWLAAVRAAVDGAGPAELTELLGASDPGALVGALATGGPAQAALVRSFLPTLVLDDVDAVLAGLRRAGLLRPA